MASLPFGTMEKGLAKDGIPRICQKKRKKTEDASASPVI